MKKDEAERLATGIPPEKWAVMTRSERRQAVQYAARRDRRAQRKKEGR